LQKSYERETDPIPHLKNVTSNCVILAGNDGLLRCMKIKLLLVDKIITKKTLVNAQLKAYGS
jgi:hypothetical protein